MARSPARLAVAAAGLAAALAGSAGMGLVRSQAAGLDSGPLLDAEPCGGLCLQTFIYDHTQLAATCTELPSDALTGEPLAIAPGVVTEVRAIDGVDPERSIAIAGRVCAPVTWSLAIPLHDAQAG